MQIGESIAGYEIVGKMKPGGMASVYIGRRQGAAGFAKYVVIKVIHDHLVSDNNFVEMFLDEARITAYIEHPNVVHVHDLGEFDKHYFLVMEFVPGVTLAELLSILVQTKRRLINEIIAWIGIEIASGLHAAHEASDETGHKLGIVHRDVSPKNILIAYKGYIKIIDFGIAKAAGRITQTMGGLLKGTIRYMSPEQAKGQNLDARSDIYALGIVLWEMLAMRPLLAADSDLAMIDLARDPVITPPSEFTNIPQAFENVILKMMDPNPENRPSSCDEVCSQIRSSMPGALTISAPYVSQVIGYACEKKHDERSVVLDKNENEIFLGKPVTVVNPDEICGKWTTAIHEEKDTLNTSTSQEVLNPTVAAIPPDNIATSPQKAEQQDLSELRTPDQTLTDPNTISNYAQNAIRRLSKIPSKATFGQSKWVLGVIGFIAFLSLGLGIWPMIRNSPDKNNTSNTIPKQKKADTPVLQPQQKKADTPVLQPQQKKARSTAPADHRSERSAPETNQPSLQTNQPQSLQNNVSDAQKGNTFPSPATLPQKPVRVQKKKQKKRRKKKRKKDDVFIIDDW